MDLSIIIVSWNTRELLDRCLSALHLELNALASAGATARSTSVITRDAGLSFEVFVIDNNSQDGSADMVASKHAWVRLIRNQENLGFARANNQALRQVGGDFVLLLNPDTEVQKDAIGNLMAFLRNHPQCGVVAPQLLNSDGTIQRSCRAFPT